MINVFFSPGSYTPVAIVKFAHDYDDKVPRHLTCTVIANIEKGNSVSLTVNASQQTTLKAINDVEVNVETAQSVTLALHSQHKPTAYQTNSLSVISEQATTLFNTLTSSINQTRFISLCVCDSKQDANKLTQTLKSVQDALLFIGNRTASQVQDASNQYYSVIISHYLPLIDYTPLPVANFAPFDYTPLPVFSFHNSVKTDYLVEMKRGVLTLKITTPDGKAAQIIKKTCVQVETGKRPDPGKSPHIDPPRPPPTNPQPPYHVTITIPTYEVYAVQHVIDVTTVIGNHPVPLSKISLNYDVDAFCWTFSGVLADKSSLSLVTMTDDVPVQLSITINGHNWIVLVEKIPETRRFAQTDITLQGRSLSALLGAPYQLLSSYTAGSDMTVQQIADSLLPNGWTLNWQCATPWLIPANTYSYTQQTRLQALAKIAQDIGAVLLPSNNQQVITFQPRYPILPWNYHLSGITPDLVIPDAAIESVGVESRTQSPINAVYVHGEHNGVLAWCRLNGTAGDVLASTENNSLITDVTAARALGERILAGHATQPVTTTITTWLGGDFALAQIGWLVEVNNERAIVNGVAISVEFGKVRQTISLGENTTNPYSRLLNLLPAQPLLVGELVSSFDDKSILTLLDGGVITARGTGTVGLKYYVRNGLIESAAPDLSMNEIVI